MKKTNSRIVTYLYSIPNVKPTEIFWSTSPNDSSVKFPLYYYKVLFI